MAAGDRSSPGARRRAMRARAARRPAPCRSRCAAPRARRGSRRDRPRSIRSPIRLSRRQDHASPLNAGSSALDRSVPRIARDHRRRIDRLAARAGDQRAQHQFLHRLVAGERVGVDCASRSSSPGRALDLDRSTGAEKSRLIDSSGGSATSSKRDALLRLGRAGSAARRAISAPLSAPISAVLQRDRHRLLVRLARRVGIDLRRDAASPSPPPASCSSRAVTCGVPAWLYQILNWRQVDAAGVLQRAARNRRRSPPRRRAARNRGRCRRGMLPRPSIVRIMRITSAPLL